MKNIIYILLIPLFLCAQNNTNSIDTSTKNLILSFQFGNKIYSGNKLLDNKKFTREGVFCAFNFFTKKDVSKKTSIITSLSFSLSNAVAKEIEIGIPETDIEFITKIPNILACNINYSITTNKKINRFLDHGISLQFRMFPLFYKKGKIISNELHSLGGFISSEENGSLPDLSKPTQLTYIINYMFNDLTSISVLVFLHSDWSINNSELYPLYPGLGIKFERIINQNFQPPWLWRFNK